MTSKPGYVGRFARLWKTRDGGVFPFRARINDSVDGMLNVTSFDPEDSGESEEERSRHWVPVAALGGLEVVSDIDRDAWLASFEAADPSALATPAGR